MVLSDFKTSSGTTNVGYSIKIERKPLPTIIA
jgi:hypothetical protein